MTLVQLINGTSAVDPAFAALVASQNYPEIAAALNAATVVQNPNAGQTTTTTPLVVLNLKMMLALVPKNEAANLFMFGPFIDKVQDAIDNQDREYLGFLLEVAATAPDGGAAAISPTTVAALTPLLTATTTVTVTEPATISGPSLAAGAGLGFVSAQQVQAVLN